MVKKITFLMMALFLLALFSCQKDDDHFSELPEVSLYKDEYGKYKEEIIVYDEAKENSLFLLLHANYPGDIERYLESHELTLVYDENEIVSDLEHSISDETNKNVMSSPIPSQSLNHKVSVELITENISSKVSP